MGVSFHCSLTKKKEDFVTFLSTLGSKAIKKSQGCTKNNNPAVKYGV
jgi:hypothetical protein